MSCKTPEQNSEASPSGKPGIFWDISIALLWTTLCVGSVCLPFISQSIIRLVFVLPFALFIPGYLLLAALFPDSEEIDTAERLVFSVGLSIIITPLVGLFLNFTPWGIRLESVLASLVIIIVMLVVLVLFRRASVQGEKLYPPEMSKITGCIQKGWIEVNNSDRNRLLFYGSIVIICLVIIIGFFVITLPKPGEKFTEFFILGENRTAGSYPDFISPKTNHTLYVGISNHEFHTAEYSVNVYLTPVTTRSATIEELPTSSSGLIQSYQVVLPHNETSIRPVSFNVPNPGLYRIDLQLFNEPAPGNIGEIPPTSPSGRDSYRTLRLWVNATL